MSLALASSNAVMHDRAHEPFLYTGTSASLMSNGHRECHAVFRRIVRLSCVLACLCVGVLVPLGASAQTWVIGRLVLAQTQLTAADIEARNTTMARALFDEGLRFVDQENWQDAQDRFGRVLTLRYSAVAAYNLGLAQARLGRGVLAAAALRRLLTDVSLDPKVRERSVSLLEDVESRFAWLDVRVIGDCHGCSVHLNEDEWPWAVVGVSVPVDAGKYTLRLRAAGHVISEERFDIAPSAHVEASLFATREALLAAHNASAKAGANDATRHAAATQTSERPSLRKSGLFWGAMGVLVVGVAGVIVLGTR